MCHVLIIEDDALAALDIRHTLEAAGATSFSFAASEREALEEARSRRPAVITSDVMLGDSSGVAAVRSIAAELGPVPIIFITGTPDHCDGCPARAVIEKPFDAGILASVFRDCAPL
jgi:CheY-like chemotaxis protein